ncbi:PilZ domain-containing protein [Hoeflea ulvae]|uniref:PilZ domain-containing protein n=1 Tax=Hoeflea ulvae TaxID=2983764 RepID=A0ABT3YAL3_9HYPH|nr:PilZ domain-containing protein [Hoeflea ulvae]MCY0092918.1 PilZ domain-containing protein [Hoeflea ulvae]
MTRLANLEQRQHQRRPANKPSTVYFLAQGVRGYASQRCRMTNISESGCHLSGLLPSQVPEFLYLVFDGVKVKFPCAVIARSDIGLHLKFLADLPTDTVEKLAQPKLRPKKPN